MKKTIILAAVFATSLHISAQSNIQDHGITAVLINSVTYTTNKDHWLIDDSMPVVKNGQYHLDISKKRSKTGLSLLVTGSALVTAGFLIGDRHSSSFEEATVGVVMGGSGILCTLGSIPFFISSSVNKQRAVLAVSIQPRSSIASSPLNKNITGISLNIPIH